jgi:hypothetical protein
VTTPFGEPSDKYMIGQLETETGVSARPLCSLLKCWPYTIRSLFKIDPDHLWKRPLIPALVAPATTVALPDCLQVLEGCELVFLPRHGVGEQ